MATSPVVLSVGNASEGSEDRAFTDTQTTLVGREDVDIAVEGHTQVDGAVVAAQNGELKLDTGTFGFRDLKDNYLLRDGSWSRRAQEAGTTYGFVVDFPAYRLWLAETVYRV